ncbi:MAG TPA: SUMF1/EgtB/PvdO family nonheme iron enzyme, partial [Fontimonas sp.]
ADALAYAQWLGRDLPSEVEWEFAAKAGRDNETADATLRDAAKKPQANFWQGLFPYQDDVEDGYSGRAPVGCFAANPNGLHDMVGNVWEWTRDAYVPGMGEALSGVPRQVIKGGSYLCAANYCERARASSRQGQEADLPTSHLGFRTVLRP